MDQLADERDEELAVSQGPSFDDPKELALAGANGAAEQTNPKAFTGG